MKILSKIILDFIREKLTRKKNLFFFNWLLLVLISILIILIFSPILITKKQVSVSITPIEKIQVAIIVSGNGSWQTEEVIEKVRFLNDFYKKENTEIYLQVINLETPTNSATRKIWINSVLKVSEDSEVKAIIVCHAPEGTSDVFKIISTNRPELIRVALAPQEKPEEIQYSSTLVIDNDFIKSSWSIATFTNNLSEIFYINTQRKDLTGKQNKILSMMKMIFLKKNIKFTILDLSKTLTPQNMDSLVPKILDELPNSNNGRVGLYVSEGKYWAIFAQNTIGKNIDFLGSMDTSFTEFSKMLDIKDISIFSTNSNTISSELMQIISSSCLITQNEGVVSSLLDGSIKISINLVKNPGVINYMEIWNDNAVFSGNSDFAAVYYVDPESGIRSKNHLLIEIPLFHSGNNHNLSKLSNPEISKIFYQINP